MIGKTLAFSSAPATAVAATAAEALRNSRRFMVGILQDMASDCTTRRAKRQSLLSKNETGRMILTPTDPHAHGSPCPRIPTPTDPHAHGWQPVGAGSRRRVNAAMRQAVDRRPDATHRIVGHSQGL